MNIAKHLEVASMQNQKKPSAIRIKSAERGKQIIFYVNGRRTKAYLGETIHAALLAAGYRQIRKSKKQQPRGVFCGMGVCYECQVTVNNSIPQQACMTFVQEGMEVEIDDL